MKSFSKWFRFEMLVLGPNKPLCLVKVGGLLSVSVSHLLDCVPYDSRTTTDNWQRERRTWGFGEPSAGN
eukprot:gene20359-24424_t